MDTYSDIYRTGIERGDTRGRKVAYMAKNRQLKDYLGIEVIFREEDDTTKGYTEHGYVIDDKLSIELGDQGELQPHYRYKGSSPTRIIINFPMSLRGEESYLGIEVFSLNTGHPKVMLHRGGYGKKTYGEFDRKSAKLLTKMVKDFTSEDINPTIFKQF